MAACYLQIPAHPVKLIASSRAQSTHSPVFASAQGSSYPPSQTSQQLPAFPPPSATTGRFASSPAKAAALTTEATPNRHASTVPHAASAAPADLAPTSDVDAGSAPESLTQRERYDPKGQEVRFFSPAMDVTEDDGDAGASAATFSRATLESAPYAFASLPPTPVFPSAHAMSAFLSAFANVLQNVPRRGRLSQSLPSPAGSLKSASSELESASPVSAAEGSTAAVTVSGASLAAAGAAVVERVRIGLLAMMGHPTRGVRGGTAWLERKAAAEVCLEELERDLVMLRSSRHDLPSSTVVRLATLHCVDAARIIRSL
ncbi:hypothetical protein CLOM_g6726 [Closterium sp. NIES-68]|nr:hypothetical protein CLOM_g6726 [Closterium sp. NIES-68]GJP71836.1 hypothetical protein CLOP_g2626 [Closterium sp. NIES-67]